MPSSDTTESNPNLIMCQQNMERKLGLVPSSSLGGDIVCDIFLLPFPGLLPCSVVQDLQLGGESEGEGRHIFAVVTTHSNIHLESSDSQFLITDSGTKIRNGPGFPRCWCKYTSSDIDWNGNSNTVSDILVNFEVCYL